MRWLGTVVAVGVSALAALVTPGCESSDESAAAKVRCVLDLATCSCGDPFRDGGVVGEAVPTCADQVPAPRRCCKNESGCWCDPFTCYGGGETNICACGFGNRKSTDIECITVATGVAENKAFASGDHCCASSRSDRGHCECKPSACEPGRTEVARCNADTVDPICPFDAVIVDSCEP